MPQLRPPILVSVPEEWDWGADRPASSAHNPITRLANIIQLGLASTFPGDYNVVRGEGTEADMIFIARRASEIVIRGRVTSAADRILISAGNPHEAPGAWHAIDRDTPRSPIGKGSSERQAALSLLSFMLVSERGSDAACTALCAEIARRWP